MTAKEAVEDPRIAARYEELLAAHLGFYEALRLRERRPRSAAQRQFQDVAWGRAFKVPDVPEPNLAVRLPVKAPLLA